MTLDLTSWGCLTLNLKACCCKCIWRVLMSRRRNYRDGLDATTAPSAGPARSVEQEAADLPLHAGSHLTPLTAPHDSRWEGKKGKKPKRHIRQTDNSGQRCSNVNFSWNKPNCFELGRLKSFCGSGCVSNPDVF